MPGPTGLPLAKGNGPFHCPTTGNNSRIRCDIPLQWYKYRGVVSTLKGSAAVCGNQRMIGASGKRD
jgi:hypothetical protein